jgi:hypothetical protein
MYVYIPLGTVCVAQDDADAKINGIEFSDNSEGSWIMDIKW